MQFYITITIYSHTFPGDVFCLKRKQEGGNVYVSTSEFHTGYIRFLILDFHEGVLLV